MGELSTFALSPTIINNFADIPNIYIYFVINSIPYTYVHTNICISGFTLCNLTLHLKQAYNDRASEINWHFMYTILKGFSNA